MLEYDPIDRISAKRSIAHPLFDDTRNNVNDRGFIRPGFKVENGTEEKGKSVQEMLENENETSDLGL